MQPIPTALRPQKKKKKSYGTSTYLSRIMIGFTRENEKDFHVWNTDYPVLANRILRLGGKTN